MQNPTIQPPFISPPAAFQVDKSEALSLNPGNNASQEHIDSALNHHANTPIDRALAEDGESVDQDRIPVDADRTLTI